MLNQLAPLNLDRLITGKPFDIGPDASQAHLLTQWDALYGGGNVQRHHRGQPARERSLCANSASQAECSRAYYGATGLRCPAAGGVAVAAYQSVLTARFKIAPIDDSLDHDHDLGRIV